MSAIITMALCGKRGGKKSFRDFKQHFLNGAKKIEYGKTIKEYWDEAQDLIAGKISMEAYAYKDTENDPISSETALISKSSKASLTVMQRDLEERRNKAELIRKFVGIEMQRRKQELDKIKDELKGVLEVFNKQIKKIMRVITTIELYLGIDEELFQIQEGPLAPADTPISFRQLVLYMDEEIGHWKDGGLDFQDIKWFDEWLITDNNYKTLIPEEKGMVVFRPRRFEKDYGNDPWVNAMRNLPNMNNTYLLIRNGETLYRVFTEKIVILPRLFPQKKELMRLIEDVNKAQGRGSSWDEEKAKDKVDDLMYQYRKRAVLMQGLIDRTEIFHPLPAPKVNIFNMDDLGDKINFIYDDEETLPSGRLSFSDWRKQGNDKVGKGSRILITAKVSRDVVRDRIYYYCNEHTTPTSPPEGVYEVAEYNKVEVNWLGQKEFDAQKKIWDKAGIKYEVLDTQKDKYQTNWHVGFRDKKFGGKDVPEYEDGYKVKSTFKHLTILYNPGDTIYNRSWSSYSDYQEPHERKIRIRFQIYTDDTFFLNYDQLDLGDVYFYLKSRVDRPNYLHMIPTLEEIVKHRTKELFQEKEFAKLVHLRSGGMFEEPAIMDAIEWWKYKNMWKRPIAKDDTKALRMVERYLKTKK